MDEITLGRQFLKATAWARAQEIETDQRKGIPHPPLQRPAPDGAPVVRLPDPQTLRVGEVPLRDAISSRRSRRRFTADPLTLEELTFLLWSVQGVQRIVRDGVSSLRTVPSATRPSWRARASGNVVPVAPVSTRNSTATPLTRPGQWKWPSAPRRSSITAPSSVTRLCACSR
ncbi:MAG TPA: hypothetical protein PKM13_02070, partial [Candidatus Bipolaricaulis anaerobius]|nr:hypothetical protein [Candidatus Bipolaricaulis anaerobius]